MTPSWVRISNWTTLAAPLAVVTLTLSLKMSLMSLLILMLSPDTELRLVSPAGIRTAFSATMCLSNTDNRVMVTKETARIVLTLLQRISVSKQVDDCFIAKLCKGGVGWSKDSKRS